MALRRVKLCEIQEAKRLFLKDSLLLLRGLKNRALVHAGFGFSPRSFMTRNGGRGQDER